MISPVGGEEFDSLEKQGLERVALVVVDEEFLGVVEVLVLLLVLFRVPSLEAEDLIFLGGVEVEALLELETGALEEVAESSSEEGEVVTLLADDSVLEVLGSASPPLLSDIVTLSPEKKHLKCNKYN